MMGQSGLAGLLGLQQNNPYAEAYLHQGMIEEQYRAARAAQLQSASQASGPEPDNPVLLLLET